MAHIPKQVIALLQELAARLPVVLGKNLAGIYIYGSLTQGSFNSKRSDVDCIVVTNRELSDSQSDDSAHGSVARRSQTLGQLACKCCF